MPSEDPNDLLLAKLTFETQRFHGLQHNDPATQSNYRVVTRDTHHSQIHFGAREPVESLSPKTCSAFYIPQHKGMPSPSTAIGCKDIRDRSGVLVDRPSIARNAGRTVLIFFEGMTSKKGVRNRQAENASGTVYGRYGHGMIC